MQWQQHSIVKMEGAQQGREDEAGVTHLWDHLNCSQRLHQRIKPLSSSLSFTWQYTDSEHLIAGWNRTRIRNFDESFSGREEAGGRRRAQSAPAL